MAGKYGCSQTEALSISTIITITAAKDKDRLPSCRPGRNDATSPPLPPPPKGADLVINQRPNDPWAQQAGILFRMQPLCARRPSSDLPYISTMPITHAGATPATQDPVLNFKSIIIDFAASRSRRSSQQSNSNQCQCNCASQGWAQPRRIARCHQCTQDRMWTWACT